MTQTPYEDILAETPYEDILTETPVGAILMKTLDEAYLDADIFRFG